MASNKVSSLSNKVVLITGASSGLGAGAALHFASLGARYQQATRVLLAMFLLRLSLVGRNSAALEDVRRKCVEAGSDDVITLRHDLAEEEECRLAVSGTVEHFK